MTRSEAIRVYEERVRDSAEVFQETRSFAFNELGIAIGPEAALDYLFQSQQASLEKATAEIKAMNEMLAKINNDLEEKSKDK